MKCPLSANINCLNCSMSYIKAMSFKLISIILLLADEVPTEALLARPNEIRE